MIAALVLGICFPMSRDLLCAVLKEFGKKNPEKVEMNLIIALSWFMSLMNQMHINIEEEIWKRFPGVCSYCGSKPCECARKKTGKRRKVKIVTKKKQMAIQETQKMFAEIYPSSQRTIEDAGIHLAEEMGELSEAYLAFRGNHREETFNNLKLETADLLSCFMGVFNSLGLDLSKKLARMFPRNCHICKKAPCQCTFEFVVNYKS